MKGALFLIFAFIVYGVIQVWMGYPYPNSSPLLALFFCCGALLPGRAWLLLPWAAWFISAPLLSWLQGYPPGAGMLGQLLGLAVIWGLGLVLKREPSRLKLLGGAVGCCLGYYLVTNLFSFAFDPRYVTSMLGLQQALWAGLPSDLIPTWVFLRNSLIANGLFAMVFIYLASPRERWASKNVEAAELASPEFF